MGKNLTLAWTQQKKKCAWQMDRTERALTSFFVGRYRQIRRWCPASVGWFLWLSSDLHGIKSTKLTPFPSFQKWNFIHCVYRSSSFCISFLSVIFIKNQSKCQIQSGLFISVDSLFLYRFHSIYSNFTVFLMDRRDWVTIWWYLRLVWCRDLCNLESIVCIVSAIALADENLTGITDHLLSEPGINDAYFTKKKLILFHLFFLFLFFLFHKMIFQTQTEFNFLFSSYFLFCDNLPVWISS